MTRTFLGVLSLSVLTPVLAAGSCTRPHRHPTPHPILHPTGDTASLRAGAGQGQEAPVRKRGTILKGDVDAQIGAIAQLAHQDAAAPYATDLTAAAQILCAMGHCHRFYVAIDHPRIKATLALLIRARTAEGAFGNGAADAAATAWVADALEVMDGDRYRDEIATARQWLEQQGKPPSAWQGVVSKVLGEVRADLFPEDLGKRALRHHASDAAHGNGAAADPAAQVELLVHLVACQTANRLLDAANGGGQEPNPKVAISPAQTKAFAFLLQKQKDGVFEAVYGGKSFPDPAITGFGLLALQTRPKAARTETENAAIDRGLRWLLQGQGDDGSFGQQVQNYTTSVVVGALVRWDDPAARPAVQKAQKYLLHCQHAEQDGYSRSDRDYGSIGYGDSQRGDLSNLNFALQALRESGLPADHDAFQKAIVFLQRSQNLKSVNDFAGKVSDPDQQGKLLDITSGDDGGAAYYPGNSAAGYVVTPDGKSMPRSYGSMTYALLKSYTLCGVKADDPRVQRAVDWISTHWTLVENPGFDVAAGDPARYAGLFYYYMVLSQALDLAGVEEVTTTEQDGKAKKIAWRQALRSKLEGMQAADGSWKNDKNQRWMEGFDVLCTCYALLALERCH